MNQVLSHLPKLPALDDATRALFEAIVARDEAMVRQALQSGARLDQPEPYRASKQAGSDVEGGLLPLQAACSNTPQRPLQLGIVQALLEAGAQPDAIGVLEQGETAAALVCQRLPQNGPAALELLAQHGARMHVGLIEQALTAHQTWSNHKGPVQYLAGTLDTLWDALPGSEKSKLSVEMMMKIVPNQSEPLDYEQIKRVQWLSTHCQVGTPDLASKLQERRDAAATPAPGRGGMKLH